ncbi:hypothetical protein H6P81_010342 [Aristolochia fimbriata]|uniref:Uncharacterized protein n=1 Tax=Aristolochia fimbriata TaxID=158543 RepID=A0AAV7ERU1_ARIFI|nr:hypothetical protein H6P81_010342 [Aristolochia fimbriata]
MVKGNVIPQLPARALAAASLGCIFFAAVWIQVQAACLSAVVEAAFANLVAPLQQSEGGFPVPLLRYLMQGVRSLTTSLHWMAALLRGSSSSAAKSRAEVGNTITGERRLIAEDRWEDMVWFGEWVATVHGTPLMGKIEKEKKSILASWNLMEYKEL